MSDPISPAHSSKSWELAGRPLSSLAAQSVVAAFPLPPPSPAPDQSLSQVVSVTSQYLFCSRKKETLQEPNHRAQSSWKLITCRDQFPKANFQLDRLSGLFSEQVQGLQPEGPALKNQVAPQRDAPCHLQLAAHNIVVRKDRIQVDLTLMTRLVPSVGKSGAEHWS